MEEFLTRHIWNAETSLGYGVDARTARKDYNCLKKQ